MSEAVYTNEQIDMARLRICTLRAKINLTPQSQQPLSLVISTAYQLFQRCVLMRFLSHVG